MAALPAGRASGSLLLLLPRHSVVLSLSGALTQWCLQDFNALDSDWSGYLDNDTELAALVSKQVLHHLL